VTDVKANLEQLKVLDDDRVRTIDTVEKLEKSGRNSVVKADGQPLQYGANANPFNSSTYTYQVSDTLCLFKVRCGGCVCD
jgi:hypothetical protein